MSLKARLGEDLKQSMRNRDSARLSAIRYLRSEIHNAEIERRSDLDDEGVIDLLSRQARQRRESIDAFRKGNRPDLVEKEEAELALILEYLPQQLTADEIADIAQKAISEAGATGPQDIGKVMGRVMPQVKGKAEGRVVSRVVSELLKGLAQ